MSTQLGSWICTLQSLEFSDAHRLVQEKPFCRWALDTLLHQYAAAAAMFSPPSCQDPSDLCATSAATRSQVPTLSLAFRCSAYALINCSAGTSRTLRGGSEAAMISLTPYLLPSQLLHKLGPGSLGGALVAMSHRRSLSKVASVALQLNAIPSLCSSEEYLHPQYCQTYNASLI